MAFQLEPFFEYYAGEPQQREGITMLQQAMDPKLLSDDAAWVKAYRGQLPQQQPPLPGMEGEAMLANPLNVTYDCQLDNPSGDGWRECFSSSCAMAAKFWLPELEINDYHRRRPSYGDSTDPSAQIRCLESFGLKARFGQMGSVQKLKAQIDRGRPAPVGFLHHGPTSAPSGGGHYILAIGYTEEHLIAHDPYGELDTVNGGYPKTGGTYGKEIRYSWKNWAPRWSVSNDHDGWGLDIWLPGKSEGGAHPTKTGNKGLALIKEFEGCRLEAYVCPAGVLTIGVGHTGPDVKPQMVITQSEADRLLQQDVQRFEKAVIDQINVPLDQCEFDALVSFAFNCGAGALSESTLRRRLNAGEEKPKVFAEELPRWTSGGMAGLVRRRDAEVKLANQKQFP